MTTIGRADLILGANTSALLKGLSKTKKEMKKLSADAEKMSKKFAKVGAVFGGFAALSVKTAAGFEQSMARVGAITGSVGEEFDNLTATARDLAAQTKFTASETADAMGFMAMAGFDANKIMGALPGVLELSSASMLDVASAADIATNIMSGFGVEAQDLGKVNDVLVKALTSSNVDLSELGQAMKFVGPVAKSLGISIEETAASLGVLGDAGLKGGIAGRNLRSVITKMIKPSKEAKRLFDQMGISLVDAQGNFVGITEAIRQFQSSGLTAIQTTEAFGEQATIISALMARGADSIDEFTKSLEDSGGTASRISKRQMATLEGGIKQLGSSFEDLRIIIGDNIAPAVGAFAKALKGLIDAFRSAPKPIQEMASTLIALVGTIGLVGAGLALTASKLALASAATTGWTAAITGGLAIALKGLAAALVPIGAAIAAAVISFKAVQAITGDTTPFFETVAKAFDRANESAHAFRTTMHNLGMALGDAAIKIVTLNGLFGLVDMDRLTDMSERSAVRFSDASFEAEHFGGSVVDASQKAADALSEVRDMAQATGEEIAEGMSVIDGMNFEIPQTQSLIDPAGAAAEKREKAAAKRAADAAKKFADAVKSALKSQADEAFDAKVSARVQEILFERGALKGEDLTEFLEAQRDKAQKRLGDQDFLAGEIGKNAKAIREKFGELAAGFSDFALLLPETQRELEQLADEIKRTGKRFGDDEVANSLSGFGDQVAMLRTKLGDAAKGLTDIQVIQVAGRVAAEAKKLRDRFGNLAKGISDVDLIDPETVKKLAAEQAKENAEKQAKKFALAADVAMAAATDAFAGNFFDAAKSAISMAAAAAGAGPIADAALSIVDAFRDAVVGAFETAFSQARGLFEGVVGGALDFIGDDRLGGAVQGVGKVFDDVVGSAQEVGGSLAKLAPFAALAAINLFNFALMATGVVAALSPLIALWGGVAIAVAAVAAALVGLTVLVIHLAGFGSILVAAVAAIKAAVAAVLSAIASLATAVAGLFVVVALVGVFAFLATKTKALGKIQERMGKSVDRVVDALEPMVKSLDPLTVIFDRLVDVLIPFASAIGKIFIGFQDEIFAAAKFLAVTFATLAIAGVKASNSLLDGAQKFLRAIAGLLPAVFAALGVDAPEEITDFANGLNDAAAALEDFKISTEEMETALDNLKALTLGDAFVELMRDTLIESLDEAIDKFGIGTFAGLLSGEIDDIKEATDGLTDSLTNVPEGFKVARERFDAMDPVAQDLTDTMASVDDMGIQSVTDRIIGSLSEFADRLGSISFGDAAAQAAGGAFPLPGGVRDLQAAPSQGGTTPTVWIDKIEAVDPEDAADKIERVLASRNFRKYDSPVAGPTTIFSKA